MDILGEWKDYGINKWNDLLIYVFGKVNLDIQNDFSDPGILIRFQDFFDTIVR